LSPQTACKTATRREHSFGAFAIANVPNSPFCYFPAVDEEALFRRRLRQLVMEKYGSLDRFYLETEFSKGHLSQIIRGKRSPSLATIAKLAKVLDVKVADFFRSS
jgi:hypothetical protein